MRNPLTRLRRKARVFRWRIGKRPSRYTGIFAIALFGTTLLFAIVAAALPWNAFNSLGEFGDFVGGVANPVLALLGFLALLYTIRLQLNELSLSREELTLTRSELKRSATALEEQTAHLERQRQSQAFFDLFEMYKSVVAGIEFVSSEQLRVGKSALEKYRNKFDPYNFYSEEGWDLEKVKLIHKEVNDDLGNYLRIIYRILSFLSSSGKSAEFFADMFRAQLTTSELQLLFFNCVSEIGRPMMKYANKFELFDNMPVPSGRGFSNIAKEVDRKSFGKNANLAALSEGN